MRALAIFLLTTLTPAQDSADALVEQLTQADEDESQRAERALVRMGPAAVPALLRPLRKPEHDEELAKRALRALGRMRGAAREAVPRVCELMSDNAAPAQETLYAFDQLAPYAKNREEVDNALLGLWQRRKRQRGISASKIAVSQNRLKIHAGLDAKQLAKQLVDGNGVQRELAAQLLGENPGADEAAVFAMLKRAFARSTQRKSGSESIRAMFRWGGGSSSIGSSHDNSRAERQAIAEALVRLGSPKDIPAAAWVALLGHEDPDFARRAIQNVVLHPDRNAVTGLLNLTRHRDRTLRWDAITALGQVGAPAKRALPQLRSLTTSKQKATAARAKAAVSMIERAVAATEDGATRKR